MINIRILPKVVKLKWYENGQLQKKTVSKHMIVADKGITEGNIKTDIYTGEKYGIRTESRYKLPKVPIPYPIYEGYDYRTATKLLHFKDLNPEPPRSVFFDIETTSLEGDKGIITSICWLDSKTGEEWYTLNEGDEKKCLKIFLDYLKENDILSLIGFNSVGFDIPYLETRCLANNLHFDPKEFIQQDVMLIANKLFYFGSLDAIAQKLKVERKVETDNPIKLYNEKRYLELLEYNTQDVRVTKAIYDKLDMENFLKALWHLTWLDYDKVHSNSHICNMFYNKRMWEDNLLVSQAHTEYLGDFAGGYNFDTSGVYENIYVYDFNSLYPRIIENAHLSPENYPRSTIQYSQHKNLHLVIRKEAFEGVNEGVLDKYIKELLTLRQQFKNEGKNNEQLATKILANSVYGILSQKTAKFFLGGTHLSSTVTFIGRNMLQTVSRLISKHGIKTIYGKTDSIFINSPYSIDETSEIMQKCVDEAWFLVTGTENKTLSMDFEGVYEKLWIINKNNYCYIKDGWINTKGGSFKTTKSSKFEQDITQEILKMVLQDGVKYKVDIRNKLKPIIAHKIKHNPISYFAVKHKIRKIGEGTKTNIWDTGVAYMHDKDMPVDYGFYHYVAKVICLPPGETYEVIAFPLTYEVNDNRFIVSRRWLESQVEKILKKLNLEEKSKQIDLRCYL